MSEQATGTPRDLEAHLIARAWKDEAFRQELLSDPKAVVDARAGPASARTRGCPSTCRSMCWRRPRPPATSCCPPSP